MNQENRSVEVLNGWWDFLPIDHPVNGRHDFGLEGSLEPVQPIIPETVPSDGWLAAAYLVPGFFTDHYYPEDWQKCRNAWARTRFDVGTLVSGRRAYLLIGGAIQQAYIFVNGERVAVQEDMFIGDEVDITGSLRDGENELAVFITEFPTFPHPTNEKIRLIDHPWGCCISHSQAGIWQDVTLEWRSAVHVSDVTIRTSVRESAITVISKVRNDGMSAFDGTLSGIVEDAGSDVFKLPEVTVSVGPGEEIELTQTAQWTDYREWCHEDPHLYHLRLTIPGVDVKRERFGFREVWIDGHRMLLNGRPQRWSGEWCHKAHAHWIRPEYIRQYYKQIKDLNMNYVRMHTFPHPQQYLDIADEMGIFVCQESALHGSGPYGWDTPALWERSAKHVARMVRRDKNHPSLVLWSVENEMRWALNIVPSSKTELPKLRKLFNELEPTRPAYHDGDSSLWNEDEQPIISRHYGPPCHGWGWWEKKNVLHAGEMGRWHYASPYTALQWAGDEVYTDYRLLSQSIARDCARIVELGRANEVTCAFIWNTSGLDNFRSSEAKTFTWDDPRSRYIKPLAHRPYESEYAWWEDGAGYRPGASFEVMKQAFRPLALVIREERTQFYNDALAHHTVYVVNDLASDVEGDLTVRLEQNGTVLWETSERVSVGRGLTGTVTVHVPLTGTSEGDAVIVTGLACESGVDEVRRDLRVADKSALLDKLDLPVVAVWGEGRILPWLKSHGIRTKVIDSLSELNAEQTPIVIVAENTVEPGSDCNARLRSFVASGGRALVLEQANSIFPGVSMARMPVEMAHVRSVHHSVTRGITGADLRFFGDDPYGVPSSNSWVTLYPYLKPVEEQLVRPIIDSSGGDFSSGGLTWAPVIEAQIGTGTVIASQLRLFDRLDDLPVADHLLRNALDYLARYEPEMCFTWADDGMMARLPELFPNDADFYSGSAPSSSLLVGDKIPTEDAAEWRRWIENGQTVVVWGLTEAAKGFWEQVAGEKIELFTPEHAVYHLIRGLEHRLTESISHEDTCWLDCWTYRSVNVKNPIVDQLLTLDGGEMLLTNSERSGLDVLFGDEKATEWKRTPTLTALFDGPAPRIGGGLVSFKVGKGELVFCQVRWMPELWQFRRFLGLFLWNLGMHTATDVLAGEGIAAAGRKSDGYPTSVRVAMGVSDGDFVDLLGKAKHKADTFDPTNVLFGGWPGWAGAESPLGEVTASVLPGEGPLTLGIVAMSPEPRKFMQTVGGLPNPDLQTFLRMRGEGNIRVWVNGVEWGSYDLTGGAAVYVADIDFEAGANTVLMSWQPKSPEDRLTLAFENKDRHPETTFEFV